MDGGRQKTGCLVLPAAAAAPMKSSSYLQCFEKTDDHIGRYRDKIVQFDPYVALRRELNGRLRDIITLNLLFLCFCHSG